MIHENLYVREGVMMNKILLTVLVTVLVVLTAADADAQQGRRFSIQPRLSSWYADDAENAFGYGVAVELMLSKWFGLTFAADFWNFEGDAFSATIEAIPDWDMRDLSAGIVFYILTDGTVNPYVSAGLDYFVIDEAFKGTGSGLFASASADDTVGWHLAVGVDITVSNNFSVIAEGRYFDTSIDLSIDGVSPADLPFGEVNVTGFALLVGVEIGL